MAGMGGGSGKDPRTRCLFSLGWGGPLPSTHKHFGTFLTSKLGPRDKMCFLLCFFCLGGPRCLKLIFSTVIAGRKSPGIDHFSLSLEGNSTSPSFEGTDGEHHTGGTKSDGLVLSALHVFLIR